MKKNYRYLLIVNPEGGGGRALRSLPQIEGILKEENIDYTIRTTKEPRHATKLVSDQGKQYDIIVSVGGDGTVNEIINGIKDLDKPLGIIPIGTGNDFARSCCIPYNSIERAIKILLEDDTRMLDVGLVNGRRFINAIGLGFEGQVNDRIHQLKFLKGLLKILISIGVTFFTYKPVYLKIKIDSDKIEGTAFMLSIGNGWNVGGGMQLTPKAKLDDGYFDVTYIRDISRLRIITNFARLMNGTIDTLEEVTSYQTKELLIESEHPIPMHFDGEQMDPQVKRLSIKILPSCQAVIGNWSSDTRFDS